MASAELPEITKHLDDTFRTAKLGYHNQDLVRGRAIQTVDRKEVFFNGEKNNMLLHVSSMLLIAHVSSSTYKCKG